MRFRRLPRRVLSAIAVAVLAAALPAASQPLAPGREAEVEALFSGVGTGETAGWQVGDITIRPDRILAEIRSTSAGTVTVVLRRASRAGGVAGRTPSFDVVPLIGGGPAERVASAVARSVATRDRGSFWPASPFVPGTDDLAVFAETAWQWSFALLVLAVLAVAAHRRFWTSREGRRAALEVLLLVGSAFVVRWVIFDEGVANFRSHLPNPWLAPQALAIYGPGFEAWIRAWFGLVGVDDRTAFLAGAVAGALTVIPVYFLGWFGTGRRALGLAGAIALVVLPIHARLSPTDDPASLLALLLTAAVALVAAAGRLESAALLGASWLAWGLAATIRPEATAALAPLAALALLQPVTRRLLRRPAVLLAMGVAFLGVGATLTEVLPACLSLLGGGGAPAPGDVLKLLGRSGGSALLPPHSYLAVGLLVALGLVVSARDTRGRSLLWLLTGLSFALPTLHLAGPDFISMRYQVPLLPVAALFAGMGAVWLGERVLERRPRLRLPVVAAGPLAAAFLLYLDVLAPPPEPTFRLEYRFFREQVERLPDLCRLVRTPLEGDLGLEPPEHLYRILYRGAEWIDPQAADASTECLFWWRPSACDATDPGGRSGAAACRELEARFLLEPWAVTTLPARPGFVERFSTPTVRAGFYRLRARPTAEPVRP